MNYLHLRKKRFLESASAVHMSELNFALNIDSKTKTFWSQPT